MGNVAGLPVLAEALGQSLCLLLLGATAGALLCRLSSSSGPPPPLRRDSAPDLNE